MPLVPVSTYAAAWNPSSNKGRMFIQMSGARPVEVPIETAEELIVMLLMLGKSGVQFDTLAKDIEIPFRPTGT